MNERPPQIRPPLWSAIVYLRQSSAPRSRKIDRSRPIDNRDCRQEPVHIGWHADSIVVIDEDLGLSGSGLCRAIGFRPAHSPKSALAQRRPRASGSRSRAWRESTPIGSHHRVGGPITEP